MGIVLFTLANLHPKYRSMLKAINLVAVANVTLTEEFGIDKILEPMVDELNILATTGVEVATRSRPQRIYYALIAFIADSLASHLVGAYRPVFGKIEQIIYHADIVFIDMTPSFLIDIFIPMQYCLCHVFHFSLWHH